MSELSILIPTYNDVCYDSVGELVRQASAIEGLEYEVLVGDDGSTDEHAIARNRAVERLDRCHYLRRVQNSGRAAIRNWLAHNARYSRLLFVDSDMGIVKSDFLATYISTSSMPVYGGYIVVGDAKALQSNLRYQYEKASEHRHTIAMRSRQPNIDFHTSNFMVQRELFLSLPLDERFRRYGYEDVAWGKQLAEAGITISHIDNPVAFDRFETNESFIEKTEESLQSLHTFQDELFNYSRLLRTARQLRRWHLSPLCRLWFRLNGKRWRRRLCGTSPSLHLFNIYKLFFLLSVK